MIYQLIGVRKSSVDRKGLYTIRPLKEKSFLRGNVATMLRTAPGIAFGLQQKSAEQTLRQLCLERWCKLWLASIKCCS